VNRDGYLEEFVRFWSANEVVQKIWVSLYTPQVGEESIERLEPADRRRVISELLRLRDGYAKLDMRPGLIEAYAEPPSSPDECIFARTTTCISADFKQRITPCQFGGNPDCSNCGCIASAGLAAIARHRIFDVIPVGAIFERSVRAGHTLRRWRGPAETAANPGEMAASR
jgi:hypothetical protein